MTKYGNDDLVIYGYSQGAMIAIREKRKLAEQYPAGTTAPDIDFVLSEDLNVPNGGLLARFPGFYIPILDISFNGAEPTDTPFDTVVITRQYDGLADFPLYPLNLVADLNALLGAIYVHLYRSTSAWLPIRRRRRLFRAPTATPATTSSRPRTCRCSVHCARLGCPSR
jgi:PE-PPE domain